MFGTASHNTVAPHRTAEVLGRGSGSSGNSAQPVHTVSDSGTVSPDGGTPLAHSDAHLHVRSLFGFSTGTNVRIYASDTFL